MKVGVRFAGINAALHTYKRIIEIDWIVKTVSAGIVVNHANPLTYWSRQQLLVFDRQSDYVSECPSPTRIDRVYLQWPVYGRFYRAETTWGRFERERADIRQQVVKRRKVLPCGVRGSSIDDPFLVAE
jgi:hypothetical protein